jgi:[ribosomal protein S18]-alanine N-acetyltransferase
VTAPSGVDVVVRPMRWWDVARVTELERDAFGRTAWSAEVFWSELAGAPGTRHYVVATRGDAVVGYAGLAVNRPDADVQTIAVCAPARRRGVGDLLLAHLLDVAASSGCRQVFLEVAADNEPAQRLYVRHGFVAGHRRRHYYGPGRDAVVMTLRMAQRRASPSVGSPS